MGEQKNEIKGEREWGVKNEMEMQRKVKRLRNELKNVKGRKTEKKKRAWKK